MASHIQLDESLGRPSEAPTETKDGGGSSPRDAGYQFDHYDVENPEHNYIRREYSEMMKMMDKASAFAPDESTENTPSNFAVAGLCSRIFFCWLLPLVRALRSGSKDTDQLILGTKDRTGSSTNMFLHFWIEESQKPRPSLIRALWKSFRAKFIRALLLKLAWGVGMVVMNSYIIFLFVEQQFNYKSTPAARTKPYSETLQYVLAALFFVIPCAIGFLVHHMESMASRLGVRVRAALVSAIYSKALRAQITGVALSPILSLMTKDCVTMSQAPMAILRVTTSVFEVTLLLVALIPFVQWFAILWCVGLCIIVVPVQTWFGKIVTRIRKTNTESNNERVHIVHEVLYAIKLVKFYVWEESFAAKVINIRNAELKLLKFAAWIKTLNLAVIIALSPACSVGVFFLYAILKIKLKPMQSFTMLNIANSLRFPLFSLPSNLKILNEMFAALRRIQLFLLEPELPPVTVGKEFGVDFNDATFVHRECHVSSILTGADETEEAKKIEHASSVPKFTIKNLTLSVRKGDILAIIGSFGSGKSTILRAILGDTEIQSGSVHVKGSVAYVPQTPWIMHGTVRDNILFGKPFDRAWYMRVVRACCLLADFKMFEEHDMTFLSEGGINLSGGQRQRIALARAVYARADVCVLDSVLSALDPITGRTVFRRVARSLLKDSAIILVTHNLEVIPQCTRILALEEGNIKYIGPYDVNTVHMVFPDEGNKKEESKVAPGPAGEQKHDDSDAPKHDDHILTKIMQAKERAERNMKVKDIEQPSEIAEIAKEINDEEKPEDNHLKTDLSVGAAFYAWAKNANLFGTIFTVILFPTAQGVRIFMDFWVKYWQNDVLGKGEGSDMWYIGIYAIIFVVFVIFLVWRGSFWYYFSFRASTKLHSNFFKSIVHAPMLFFTKEPLGRILKSYSKDQDQVDDSLPDVSHLALIYASIALATIAAMCVVLPIYAVIGFVLVVVWYVIQQWLAAPVTSCKNAVARTDAQVVVHASESLHGIAVVRAFGVQEVMERESEIVLDAFGSSLFHLDHISLWTATLFDIVASLFVVISAVICILYKDTLTASDVGVIMTNSTQMLVFLGLMVNALNDSAYQLFSVGRLQHYIQTTPQEIFTKTIDIPRNDKGRPNFLTGSIDFEDVEMKYDPMKDFVLRKLTCSIKDKERIGIVGRTGAGKSTLINAIFRLTELHSGKVKVSGMDIRELDIKDLRRSLCIIPQEPVVFQGSIRSNVDPFGEFSNDELHEALKASNMYDAIMEMPGGLDTEIAEGGGNLSLGQRQLLCLTRVCLRKERKILILDEATSALDPVTDQTIQKTLREVFNQHSILTIAHRLDTIIDYDKILVLNHGKLLEFDSVPNLLKKEGGVFRQMYEGATH